MTDEEDKQNSSDNKEEQNTENNKEDYKEKYLYLLAEFDNYRKAQQREIEKYIKLSNEKFMVDLLKVLDDFDSVMKVDQDDKIKLLYNSLYSVLKKYGLEKIEIKGKDFDPSIAEAVDTVKDEANKGKIIDEIQSGYKLNEKIIRYPKVRVGVWAKKKK